MYFLLSDVKWEKTYSILQIACYSLIMTVIYILTFFFAKLKLIQTRSKVMNAGLREDMGQIRKDRMS